jgi:Tol biopolymer transport system component
LVNTRAITCYDWSLDNTGVILDYDCGLWFLDTNGVLSEVLATDCYQQAPVVNPKNGQLAFHDLDPTNAVVDGIYVAQSNGNSPQLIVTTVLGASWPEWSPDGQKLSFSDDNSYYSLDNGTNLWVVSPDGSDLSRICDFTGTTNHFPHGALWSPDSTSLVGAGTIYGTNGLWIIPLNYNRTDCQGAPTLLPTTPGDPIDFAGSIIVGQPVAPLPPLVVQTTSNLLTLSWSTNFTSIGVQYTKNFSAPFTWILIPGPYAVSGENYQYQEPIDTLVSEKFFRLAPINP